jgi:hypothetical protein
MRNKVINIAAGFLLNKENITNKSPPADSIHHIAYSVGITFQATQLHADHDASGEHPTRGKPQLTRRIFSLIAPRSST